MQLKISVIVPTYNSQKNISDCLQALERQTIDRDSYEIIVVDDGSTDATPQIVKSFSGVRLIQEMHGGPSFARNQGSKSAFGEIIAFTDADCIPSSSWLNEITAPFHDRDIIGVKGVYCSNQKNIVARFVQLEYQYKYLRMARQEYIDFIDTHSAAYRREVFLKNGGFDASFTVPSVEDQELSFRLAQKGYHMKFAPKAAVYHFHDHNLLEYWKRKYGIGYWKAYMLRWLPQKTFSDSHTPASQRLQIGLLFLGLLSSIIGFFLPPFFWAAAFFLACFILSSLSFWIYTLKNDLVVGVVYLGLLFIRAAALGAGLVAGSFSPPRKGWHDQTSPSFSIYVVKRFFDILISFFGLIFLSPVLLIAGIAICLNSPGPALFLQWRAGENGKPFRMIKLRTMVNEAESQLNEVMVMNNLKGPAFKIPNDPRITRVGRWLRRWSIDELPQLWNVLKGEMSLIGPRPEELWIVDCYSDEQRKRLAMKPGISGPMQVNGRGDLDFDDRLELELAYMQDYSFKKDVTIFFKSIIVVIHGKGAY